MIEYVRWLRDLRMDDVPIVGGKNASLGEMIHHLAAVGVLVPISSTDDRILVALHPLFLPGNLREISHD